MKKGCDNLWVLLETNDYGCTEKNLDLLKKLGIDSFWLDIKTYDTEIYRKLLYKKRLLKNSLYKQS